eukprot:m.225473 g.225473  ORF g.225473 m.225473 type:complete len:169 (+) comp54210_c0_seq18:25-531(+)
MAVFQHWTNMRLVWRIPNPEVNLLKHLCSNDCAHSNGVVLRLISRLDDDKSLHICLHCVNIPEVLEEHCCFELHTDTTVFASDGVTPFFTISSPAFMDLQWLQWLQWLQVDSVFVLGRRKGSHFANRSRHIRSRGLEDCGATCCTSPATHAAHSCVSHSLAFRSCAES